MKYRVWIAFAAILFATSAFADFSHDFENQQIPPGWTQTPSTAANWAVALNGGHLGGHALRSGAIGHGQSAAIEFTTTLAEDSVLSFMLRMESEPCCDVFTLSVDNEVLYSLSGMHPDWLGVRRVLTAGTHVVRFRYAKDATAAAGLDAAFIDDVRLGPAPPVSHPLLQAPGTLVVSSEGRIEQYTQGMSSITHHFTRSGDLDFSPAGDLYINDADSRLLVRYQPSNNTGVVVASDVELDGFSALADRAIGGRGYCGGYTLAYYSNGATFDSADPSPCRYEWDASDQRGDDLWVLHGNDRVARRSAAVPDAELYGFSVDGYPSDLVAAPDGNLWLLSGTRLSLRSPEGKLLGSWTMSESAWRLAVREDGLLAVAGNGRFGLVRPDHGYEKWQTAPSLYQLRGLAFVPGLVPDADGDGMPAWFEVAFGLNAANAADAALDGDGDGLSNLREFQGRSKPNVADSDSDGAHDGLEATAGSDPLDDDSDGDGVRDGIEIVQLHSDPTSEDSDADGMGDYYEFTNGLDPVLDDRLFDRDGDGLGNFAEFELGTRPAVADSDADGLGDGAEVDLHGTLPLDNDTDNDGLTDGAEINTHHTSAVDGDSDADGLDDKLEVATLHSDPNSSDSDADGMPDGWEHANGTGVVVADQGLDGDGDGLSNAGEFAAGSDPQRADTDHDQLNDGAEIAHGSDPVDMDSDGDRLPDGWEVAYGHDPATLDSDGDDDGDTFTSLEEYWSGTAPGERRSKPRPSKWDMLHGGVRHTGYQPHALALPAFAPMPLAIDAAQRPEAVVQGNGLIHYVLSSYHGVNRLVAVDAGSGAEVWTRDFGAAHYTSPPALADGRIYVQVGRPQNGPYQDKVYALDAATGNELFATPLPDSPYRVQAPVAVDDTLYVQGGWPNAMYAFNKVTGVERWSMSLSGSGRFGGPAVDGAYVYSHSPGGLEMMARASGVKVATIANQGVAWSIDAAVAPLLGGYGNAIVCNGPSLAAFDLARRAPSWSRPGCGHDQPTAANGLVFTYSGSQLLAYEEVDGTPVWSKEIGSPLAYNVLVTRDHAIVSSATQTYFVRLSDRGIALSLPAAGDKVLTDTGRLIVAAANGLQIFDLPLVPGETVFFDSFE